MLMQRSLILNFIIRSLPLLFILFLAVCLAPQKYIPPHLRARARVYLYVKSGQILSLSLLMAHFLSFPLLPVSML